MTVFIFWFLFAVATGIYANGRGRSGIGWFVLSMLITPILGLLFCAVSKNLAAPISQPADGASTHRKCPACCEWVLPMAVVCKHCSQPLTPDPGFAERKAVEQQTAEFKVARDVAIGLGVVLTLFSVAWLISKY